MTTPADIRSDLKTPAGSQNSHDWQRFLDGGLCVPLEPLTRFKVTGADRVRYLNGQCSNDVRKLTVDGPAQMACVLSPRGKLDAVIHVRATADALLIDCPAEVGDALEVRLQKYIISDDVEIDAFPFSPDSIHWVPGRNCDVATLLHGFPHHQANRFGIVGYDLQRSGTDERGALHRAVESTTPLMDLIRVIHRMPAWGAELSPDTLPAEAGLDKLAVDFHKGCYLGQEVVSRIESVGRTNRVLQSFIVESGDTPAVGDEFPDPANPDKCGATITTVAWHFGVSKPVGLCYTRRSVEVGSTLQSVNGGTSITISELFE